MNAEQEKLTEIEQLRRDRDRLKWMVNYAGICELSAHNFNLKSWANELEERAIKAEKERDEALAANAELKDQLDHVTTSLDEGTLPYWQSKHDRLLGKWFKAEAANAEMRSACGMDTEWPVFDVLKQLILATEHLLKDHNCDTKGHEAYSWCVGIAQKQIPAMRHALSLESGKGWRSPEEYAALEKERDEAQMAVEESGYAQQKLMHELDALRKDLTAALAANADLRCALHDIFELASKQKSNRDCAVDEGLIATALASVRVIRRVADERKGFRSPAQVRELIEPVLVLLDRLAKLPNTNIDNHWIAFNAIHELARLEAALKELDPR